MSIIKVDSPSKHQNEVLHALLLYIMYRNKQLCQNVISFNHFFPKVFVIYTEFCSGVNRFQYESTLINWI